MNEKQLRTIMREELKSNSVPQLYDSKQTAKMLGVSAGTLANWRLTGSNGPKPTFVGGAVRYQLSEINAWLQENTH